MTEFLESADAQERVPPERPSIAICHPELVEGSVQPLLAGDLFYRGLQMPFVPLSFIINFAFYPILGDREDMFRTNSLIKEGREFQICQFFERFIPSSLTS